MQWQAWFFVHTALPFPNVSTGVRRTVQPEPVLVSRQSDNPPYCKTCEPVPTVSFTLPASTDILCNIECSLRALQPYMPCRCLFHVHCHAHNLPQLQPAPHRAEKSCAINGAPLHASVRSVVATGKAALPCWATSRTWASSECSHCSESELGTHECRLQCRLPAARSLLVTIQAQHTAPLPITMPGSASLPPFAFDWP